MEKGELERQLEHLVKHRPMEEQIEYLIGLLATHHYLGEVDRLAPNHLERVEIILRVFVEQYPHCGPIVRGIMENLGQDLKRFEEQKCLKEWQRERMFR